MPSLPPRMLRVPPPVSGALFLPIPGHRHREFNILAPTGGVEPPVPWFRARYPSVERRRCVWKSLVDPAGIEPASHCLQGRDLPVGLRAHEEFRVCVARPILLSTSLPRAAQPLAHLLSMARAPRVERGWSASKANCVPDARPSLPHWRGSKDSNPASRDLESQPRPARPPKH